MFNFHSRLHTASDSAHTLYLHLLNGRSYIKIELIRTVLSLIKRYSLFALSDFVLCWRELSMPFIC